MPWFHRQNPQQILDVEPHTTPESVLEDHPKFIPYIPPPLELLETTTGENSSTLRSLLQTSNFRMDPSPLPIVLGHANSNPVVLDGMSAEHVLIAGAPPVMRDSLVHSIVLGLIYRSSPDAVKMVFLDGDHAAATLPIYNPIPQLLSPVVTDLTKMAGTLRWVMAEIARRQQLYTVAHVNDIGDYNSGAQERLPLILVVFNEFVPLINKYSVVAESEMDTIIQNGARHGIHLLVTTQLPETTTLTDLFPLSLKHRVPTKILWAGPWAASTDDQPWLLHTSHNRTILPFHGIWVSPSEAGRVADYFAPSGSFTIGALNELDSLSGIEFEETLRIILRDKGWQLDLTAVTGDFGADLIGRGPDGASWVIQAKRWKGSVGIEAVQQVLGAQAYYQSQKMLLVTTAPLTKAALELAERTHVTVWTREEVLPLFTSLRERQIATHRLHQHSIKPREVDTPTFATGEASEIDGLFWNSVNIIVESKQASISLLQRRMRIGYTRAAQIIDTMESRGYIGPADGVHPRKVYLSDEQYQLLTGHQAPSTGI